MLAVPLFFLLIYVWSDVVFDSLSVFGYDLSSRISDSRSSAARIDKYVEFLSNLNENYFFPDFDNKNIVLVSESSYFTYINYFGIFGCVLLLAFVSQFYRIDLVKYPKGGPWVYVFVYYCFVGLFESTITSFPNNQLLMISAGSIIALRGVGGRKMKYLR